MRKMSRKSRYAFLAMAVTASLLGASVAHAADTEVKTYERQLVESENYGDSARKAWNADGIRTSVENQETFNNDVTYTFGQDVKINPKTSNYKGEDIAYWGGEVGGIYWAGYNDGTINANGHSVDVDVTMDGFKSGTTYSTQSLTTAAIYMNSGTLTIKNVDSMNLGVGGPSLQASRVHGIYVNGGGSQSSQGYDDGDGFSHLTIQNADGWDHAIKFHADKNVTAGILVDQQTGGADLDITGMVDIDVNARGVSVMGSQKPVSQSTPEEHGRAYIGGGRIKSTAQSLYASSGELFINSKLGADGMLSAADGTRDVQITGDVYAGDRSTKYSKTVEGKLGIALNTKDSFLTGKAQQNPGMSGGTGHVYMLLTNGAVWNNQQTGTYTNNTSFNSTLTSFTGADSAASTGYIYQKDSGSLNLGNVSGFTKIFYEHSGDGTEKSQYTGGDVLVNTAKEGSEIDLVTNNVDTTNESTATKALNALASKLYYSAYRDSAGKERNLTGTVSVASGLTASAQTLRLGYVDFDSATGYGSFNGRTTPDGVKTDSYNSSITGNVGDDQYYVKNGVLTDTRNVVYTFKNNTEIQNPEGLGAIDLAAYQKATVDASGRTLTLTANEKDDINVFAAATEADAKNLTIKAKQLNLRATVDDSVSEAYDGNIGFYAMENDDSKATRDIHADTDIYVTGKGASYGIKAEGKNAVTLHGNLTMKGSGLSDWGVENKAEDSSSDASAGLYATGREAFITVDGNADMAVKGNGLVADQSGSVTVKGGTIRINQDTSKDRYALLANGGTISVNESNGTAGTSDVTMSGNVQVRGGGKANVGLATKDSSWTGVSNVSGGTLTLDLANGASWMNSSYGKALSGFGGSRLSNLRGGSDAAHQGYIVAGDTHKTTVDNYSGYTTIFYAHSGNGEATADYAAGDTVISKAASGSQITLSTDNTGLSTDNTDSVAKVLNALAGKLTYSAYANGEKNLAGKVQIASGLTASSMGTVLKTGDITFDAATGKGTYAKSAPAEEKSNFTTQLTGNTASDTEYAGNIKDGVYTFSKDSIIDHTSTTSAEAAIDAKKDLTIQAEQTLTVKNTMADGAVRGINQGAGRKTVINAKKLTLDASASGRTDVIYLDGARNNTRSTLTINGNLDMTATNTKDGDYTNGAYAKGNADIVVNGNVNSKVDSNGGTTVYYGATNLYATSEMGGGHNSATITVNGDVNLSGGANGVFANIGGAAVTINGGGTIEVPKSDRMGYAALRAENGTVSMNVSLDKDGNATGSAGHKVNIKGNISATTGAINAIDGAGQHAVINLGLDTADSTLTGWLFNGYRDGVTIQSNEGGSMTFTGAINLWLANGAQWENTQYGRISNYSDNQYYKPFNGSHAAKLVGGADADHQGYIIQNDEDPITVDDYSGYTTIFYTHDTNGETTDDYANGDTIIRKAAAGSQVTLSTDNTGITTTDKDAVAKVLNALAGKLTYSAYVNGEKNLTGKVQITSGLTASSVGTVFSTGDITFEDATGKGTYVKKEEPQPEPKGQTVTVFTTPLTGDRGSDTAYDKGGVLTADQVYTFTKDTSITVGNKDAVDMVAELLPDWVTTFSKSYKPVTVDADGTTLTITSGQRAIYASGNGNDVAPVITAKKLNITANETNAWRDAALVYADGSKTNLTVNGDIEGTASGTNAGAYGIYAKGGSTVTVNGNVTSKKDGGWGITSKQQNVTTGIRADKDSTVTINGLVDLSVDGQGAFAGSKGTVNLKGGTISTNADKTTGQAMSLAAFGGTVNVNMNDDKTDAAGNKVVLNGNVSTQAAGSLINVGLDTADSSLNGIIHNNTNSSGSINLYLKNGATWTNRNVGNTYSFDFAGSRLTNLYGGADEAHQGYIVASDSRNVTVDNYSGYTTVFYAHNTNGETTADYAGGDTIISKAASGSQITLSTDNKNIATDNKDTVATVLNALAGKLTYSAYVNGEKNLTGKVKIASGLTASSVGTVFSTGDITFEDGTGKGTYVKPAPVEKTSFTTQLTGDTSKDTEYAGNIKDGVYTFSKDTALDGSNYTSEVQVNNDLTVKADGKLTLSGAPTGISQGYAKNSTITAKTLKIDAAANARTEGIHLDGSTNDTASTMTINGDVDITSTNNAGGYALGAYVKGNSKLVVNGNVTSKVDGKGGGYRYYGASNLYTTGEMMGAKGAADITVNGDVNVSGNGNGIYSNIGGASITVNGGGHVEVDKDNTQTYAAIRAEDAKVNVNVNLDKDGNVTGSAGHDLTIKGDVAATTGAVNGVDTYGKNTVINVGLDTANSSLEGHVFNQYGDGVKTQDRMRNPVTFTGAINLWLANGAQWNNTQYGSENRGFTGSRVTDFHGGADESHQGYIMQNDSHNLTMDNYSGYTTVFYAHNTNGETTADYAGGDTIISKAASGSQITLSTDNKNIATDNKDTVATVLNALAGKLTYSAYANGEKNLTGKVQIASGLTASSVGTVFSTGDITFEDATGKGTYVKPAPVEKTSFTNQLTGNTEKDTEYAGNIKDGVYTFSKDTAIDGSNYTSEVQVNNDLTVKADGKLALSGAATGISQGYAKTSTINAKTLKIDAAANARTEGIHLDGSTNETASNMTINGDVDITSTNNAGGYALGAYVKGNSKLVVNGNVTSKVDGKGGGYSYYGASNLYTTGEMQGAKGAADITVNGDVNISGNGNGIYSNIGGASITVNGGGHVEVDKDNTRTYAAIRAEDAKVNMNVNLDKDGNATGSAGHDVTIKGNVAATTGAMNGIDKYGTKTVINLGLDTKDSTWEGVAYNAYGDGKTSGGVAFTGAINLWLANGAQWTNAAYGSIGSSWGGDNFKGSRLANLYGGADEAHQGYIVASDSRNVTVDNYSGYTTVFYAHNTNGETTADYAGGDTIISKAAAGSQITLSTDNKNIATDNKDTVATVLNALAGKLTYSAYVNGEKNLTGKAQIASGLTASSVGTVFSTGDITFEDTTGKGTYVKPAPEHQTTDTYSQAITGDVAADALYTDTGVRKADGRYVFEDNPTAITVDNGAAINGVDNDIILEGSGVTLEANGKDQGIYAGAGHTVSANVEALTAKGQNAVEANGENANVTINSSLTAEGTDTAVTAADGGTVTISKAKDIRGDLVADNGTINITLDGTDAAMKGGYRTSSNGHLVLNIRNGASYTLTDANTPAAGNTTENTTANVLRTMAVMRAPAAGSETAVVVDVNGGASRGEAGNILQQRTNDFRVANYSGWERVIYAHTGDGAATSDYGAGNTVIEKAAENSGIILSTDNSGIDMKDKTSVENALGGLAGKLYYENHAADNNLTGKVEIADGLTASSRSVNMGDLTYKDNGQGQYVKDSVNWTEPDQPDTPVTPDKPEVNGKITEGDYETFVMKGVRSAATTSFHAWRDNMQDTYEAADLADEDGIFAKALGGKTESDVKGLHEDNTYWGAQVGYDKALKGGWHTGVAFDYRDGDSDYLLGGKGDDKLYSIGVYGVKKMDNGSFFRVSAKAGRVKNEYHVYNELRTSKLRGDYKAAAYGVTAEYGKTFGTDSTYITPKAQLTWSRVEDKDYTAHTAGDSMKINQDAYDSFVGRIGFEAGMKKEKGSLYGALYMAHEFDGDISAKYFANDGGWKHTSFSGDDTWAELVVGGRYSLSRGAQLYVDFARDFGGDFEHQWKLNAGVRFSF